MADYRIYLINADGHITKPPVIVTSASDDAAIVQARQYVDGHDVQVWEGDRLVVELASPERSGT